MWNIALFTEVNDLESPTGHRTWILCCTFSNYCHSATQSSRLLDSNLLSRQTISISCSSNKATQELYGQNCFSVFSGKYNIDRHGLQARFPYFVVFVITNFVPLRDVLISFVCKIYECRRRRRRGLDSATACSLCIVPSAGRATASIVDR